MALTVTEPYSLNARGSEGGGRVSTVLNVVGPSSYTTGGEDFDAPFPGIGVLHFVPAVIFDSGSAIRIGVWNSSTKKLLIYVPNTGAEVANGTDLSGYSARVKVSGLG